MKASPFERVKPGQLFRDIDGNVLMRTSKAYADNEGRTPINCIVLIPNKGELTRGDTLTKTREIYCEVLDDRELSQIKLVDVHEDDEIVKE